MTPAAQRLLYVGNHCVIRTVTEDDVRALYPAQAVQAILSQYRPWLRGQSLDIDSIVKRYQWLAELNPPAELEVLVLRQTTQEPIGFIALSAIDGINLKAEFSAAFFSGQGSRAAVEALHWSLNFLFSRTAVHKLVFYVQPENLAAKQLLRSLGAGLEAVLVDEIIRDDGKRSDLCRYTLFHQQWLGGEPRVRLRRIAPLKG